MKPDNIPQRVKSGWGGGVGIDTLTGLGLSHGSHFGADYSWCRCTAVPLRWILSLGHLALKAIKFSVSMNKSESAAASDHAVQRVSKLIICPLRKKEEAISPLSPHRGNICSIKSVMSSEAGSRVFLFFLFGLKPSMWGQTVFPEVLIRMLLRVNDSRWDLLGNWSSAKPPNV